MEDGNRLYLCGTNAHSPKDWVIYVSIYHCFSSFIQSKQDSPMGLTKFKKHIKCQILSSASMVDRLRTFKVISYLQNNLTHLTRQEYVPGVGMGIAKCPYDPADNSTAVWVEKGNPGDLPALYSGTNAEFTKADTVIFRTDLINFTTGRKAYSFKRTLKYDSKWLDSEYTNTFRNICSL